MINRFMCFVALWMWLFLPVALVIAVLSWDWRWAVIGLIVALTGIPVGWLGVQGAKASEEGHPMTARCTCAADAGTRPEEKK